MATHEADGTSVLLAKKSRESQTAAVREHRHKGVLLNTEAKRELDRSSERHKHKGAPLDAEAEKEPDRGQCGSRRPLGKGQIRDAAAEGLAQVQEAAENVMTMETKVTVMREASVADETQKCARDEERQAQGRADLREEKLRPVQRAQQDPAMAQQRAEEAQHCAAESRRHDEEDIQCAEEEKEAIEPKLVEALEETVAQAGHPPGELCDPITGSLTSGNMKWLEAHGHQVSTASGA
jgi:hypothetical protein